MQAMTEVATDVPSGFEPNNPERVTTWRARMARIQRAESPLTVHETITFNDHDSDSAKRNRPDPEEGSPR